MDSVPKLPKNEDIMREATKKLEKIKHQRDIETKFLSKHESYQEYLNNFEKNLSKSIFNQKIESSKINEKTFSKIYSLLEKFSKLDPVQISNISKLFSLKEDAMTQTDELDEKSLINKIAIISEENEKLSKEKNKLKNENEVIKKENEELKKINNKLDSQYIQLNKRIEEDEKSKKLIGLELDKIKNNNLVLESKLKESNKIIDELKSKLKTYEEKIKLDLAQKQVNNNFFKTYNNSVNKITFIYLIKTKQMNYIYDYLDANDLINFRACSKDIYKIFNEKIKVLNRFYLNIIKQKNNVIFKINKYDIQKNYLTKLPQLEQLIKIYSLEGKQPAQGLRLSIDNALYFLNKVVKAQLGFKPSRQRNIEINNKNNFQNNNIQISNENSDNNTAMDSFFGGVKSLFGFGSNSTQTTKTIQNNNMINRNNISKTQVSTPNKLKTSNNSLNVSPIVRSTANSKESSFISNDNNKFDFVQSDELILNEINNSDYGLKSNYEFEYNTSDDINKYLNKFLKSPFPVEKLTDFITQLCFNFCELLFNAYSALKDFHQLGIVNKTLNERFKFFYEANKKKDKIIKLLNIEKNQLLNNSNKIITNEQRDLTDKMILEGNLNISKINEEGSFDEMEKKLNLNQMSLNIANKKAELYEKKYEEIKSIYLQYKEMSLKENSDLKFQIELALKEKNEYEKKLKDLNNFFRESFKGINGQE